MTDMTNNNTGWISPKTKAPTFPCVVWNGERMHVPRSMIIRNYDKTMHYYDTDFLEGTLKEIDERDLREEPEILLWHPLPPLPKDE